MGQGAGDGAEGRGLAELLGGVRRGHGEVEPRRQRVGERLRRRSVCVGSVYVHRGGIGIFVCVCVRVCVCARAHAWVSACKERGVRS